MTRSNELSRLVDFFFDFVTIPFYGGFGILLYIEYMDHHREFGTIYYSVFFCVIFGLLLLDGLVRFLSRRLIRQDYHGGFLLIGFLIVLAEIFGIGAFYSWAKGFLTTNDLTFSNYGFYYGYFCIITAIHNLLSIYADKNIRARRYFSICLVGDATEIPGTSSRWGGVIIKFKNRLQKRVEDQSRICREAFSKKNLFEDFSAMKNATLYLITALPGVFVLGIIHNLVQFATLHLFFLNLSAGAFIALSFLSIPQISQTYLVWAIIICIIPNLSYYFVSYREMCRYIGKEDVQSEAERKGQRIGNLVLLSSSILFYLSLSKNILIGVILSQQMIIGIIMLIQLGRIFASAQPNNATNKEQT